MACLLPNGRRAALMSIVLLLCSSVSVFATPLDVVPSGYDVTFTSTMIIANRINSVDGDTRVLVDAEESPAGPVGSESPLQAGDADQDLDFDQNDLVQVLVADRYLTGRPADWGQGDWNGAPGGRVGEPPEGDGRFDQLDIITALAGSYLNGAYAAVAPDGVPGDGQTSIGYVADTGVVWIDAPAGEQLTSFEVQSASGIFTGEPGRYIPLDSPSGLAALSGKTSGGEFGSFSFGPVAEAGLSKEFLLSDLTVTGTLASGGGLGNVDLIYTVPEPSAALLAALGFLALLHSCARRRRAV